MAVPSGTANGAFCERLLQDGIARLLCITTKQMGAKMAWSSCHMWKLYTLDCQSFSVTGE